MRRLASLALAGGACLLGACASAYADESFGGRLQRGDTLLTDGSYIDVYEVRFERGVRYELRLESDDFDALLWVQPRGQISLDRALAGDDDSGGGTNARIAPFAVQRTGTYLVIVNSYQGGESGRYRLEVNQQTEPAGSRTTRDRSNPDARDSQARDNERARRSDPNQSATLRMTTYTHPTGYFSADVPAGWRVEAEVTDLSSMGMLIRCTSPDGRSAIGFAHNALSYMDTQVGYLPGNQAAEQLVLPMYLEEFRQFETFRVTRRSRNESAVLGANAFFPGVPVDRGDLSFVMLHERGDAVAGNIFCQTMYTVPPSPQLGTNFGMWQVEFVIAAYGPMDEVSQQQVHEALAQMMASLQLSPQFVRDANATFAATQAIIRDLNDTMHRMNEGYYCNWSSRSGGSRSGGSDPHDDWATYMRGGQYGSNPETGDQYWITNDHDYWFVDNAGNVVGNDTGDVPTYDRDWYGLDPIGQ